MKNKLVLTLTDIFLICSPLLILFFVLVAEGFPPGDILKKPEWSFVSVLLIVESFRDFGTVWRNRGEHEEQIASGYAFMALFLVITVLILVIDFRNFIGKSPLAIDIVYPAKFAFFGFCAVMFAITRWKRYAI